jgi:hypothetical protein
MDKRDLDELSLDIQEAFLEIGDTDNISIMRYEGGNENIYKESKKKRYSLPITITGRVKLSPVSEEISDIGRKEDINAVFTFTAKDLEDNGLLDEEVLITVDDRLKFRDTEFSILNIIPTAMLGNRFLIYKFECKRV